MAVDMSPSIDVAVGRSGIESGSRLGVGRLRRGGGGDEPSSSLTTAPEVARLRLLDEAVDDEVEVEAVREPLPVSCGADAFLLALGRIVWPSGSLSRRKSGCFHAQ